MDAITYTAARANLASTMDRVCNDHEGEHDARAVRGDRQAGVTETCLGRLLVPANHRRTPDGLQAEKNAILIAQLRYHY